MNNEETADSPPSNDARGIINSNELTVPAPVNCVNDSGTVCTTDTLDIHNNTMANSLSQPLLRDESSNEEANAKMLSDQLATNNINHHKLSGKSVKKSTPELVISDVNA